MRKGIEEAKKEDEKDEKRENRSANEAVVVCRKGTEEEYKGRTDSNSPNGLNEAVSVATLLL